MVGPRIPTPWSKEWSAHFNQIISNPPSCTAQQFIIITTHLNPPYKNGWSVCTTPITRLHDCGSKTPHNLTKYVHGWACHELMRERYPSLSLVAIDDARGVTTGNRRKNLQTWLIILVSLTVWFITKEDLGVPSNYTASSYTIITLRIAI